MNNTDTMTQIETVEILAEGTMNGISWEPVEGKTTLALKKQALESGIKEHEWENIKESAISILSKCVHPDATSEQDTGLVIGYVQSGKTLSFTTVTALARDNNYQLIIVIAGTSLNLLGQSTNRLEEDLNLMTRSSRQWQHFKTSELSRNEYTAISNALNEWKDSTIPKSRRRSVLITTMKQHQNLDKLAYILSKIELSGVPTLVIDDEADQASLNTKVRKGGKSTTYQRILSLRQHLPNHTFLQYTATPQAPLLINLIDVLSANFVEVLSPGEDYKGGKAFFIDTSDRICTIPDDEIPTKDQQLDAPPESLLEAMRVFFLGVCAGTILDEGDGNRSMMVHPSHKTIGHKQYLNWIKRIMNNWSLVLKENGIDRAELLEGFRNSYEHLQSTVSDLPSFEELTEVLPFVLNDTELHEVNSTSKMKGNIPWHRKYSHILVGGQKMDRGFTVEGITVTYMPRGAGLGNADTIQQRARFFGYKEIYFGYCRVFLEDRVRRAYRDYVLHEQSIRESLIEHSKTGKSLDAWKRTFFLNRDYNPTRTNVIDVEYSRGNFGNRWFIPKAPHDSLSAIAHNDDVVQQFKKNLSLQEDEGSPQRTEVQKHSVADVPLEYVCEELLLKLRVTNSVDSNKFTRVLMQISYFLQSYSEALCTVYYMSKGNPRKRTLKEKSEITQAILFQGRNPSKGKITYPGDKMIRSDNITIQIHNLELDINNEKVIVPTIAIWLPKNVSPDVLVQNQGGDEDKDSYA